MAWTVILGRSCVDPWKRVRDDACLTASAASAGVPDGAGW
jgi:hypothetical protein